MCAVLLSWYILANVLLGYCNCSEDKAKPLVSLSPKALWDFPDTLKKYITIKTKDTSGHLSPRRCWTTPLRPT